MVSFSKMKRASLKTALISALLVAILGVFGVVTASTSSRIANADELDDLNKKIEESSDAYEEACDKLDELEDKISANEDKITDLEKELKESKGDNKEAVTNLYKYQRSTPSTFVLALSSDSFYEFFKTLEYLTQYQDSLLATINAYEDSLSELKETNESLEQSKKDAENARDEAKSALKEAQAARQAAMDRAAAEAAAQAAAAAASSSSSDSSSSSSSSSSSGSSTASVSSSEVDWSLTREEFIETWTARIDNYLAGSPLAGQGVTFATASWNYGVDPRWSPAISCVESSKGAICFKSHNAWGWGSSSWGSWEEAINAHVAGLARSYGSTVTVAAAKKYCPPNWSHWYNTCVSEMRKI